MQGFDKEQVTRFLRCAPPKVASEVRDLLAVKPTERDISGARYKLISVARELERRGIVKVKVIPNAA
jgi:hypothetical protein